MAQDLTLVLEPRAGGRYEIWPRRVAIPPGAITESSAVTFRLTGTNVDVFRVRLFVDDEPLSRNALSTTEVAWTWSVGFHAGIVDVRLEGATPRPVDIELLTDPHVAKLTRNEYTRMTGDLLSDTLALLALAGHRVEIASGRRTPPDIARFEFVRSRIERIERAVLEIDRAPWRRLVRVDRAIPFGRVRDATPGEIATGVRTAERLTPDDLAALPARARRLAAALNGCLPRSIARSERTVAAARREHEDALAILRHLRSFCASVVRRLADISAGPGAGGDEDKAAATRLVRRARHLVVRLDRLIRLPTFAGLTPTVGALHPTHVFLRVPAYRTIWKAYLEFRNAAADVTGNFLKVPLRRTYDLYEIWVFLRLARAAAARSAAPVSDTFVERDAAGGLRVSFEGRPFACGPFVIVFQQTYSEVWRRAARAAGSFSRRMRPDIALELADVALKRVDETPAANDEVSVSIPVVVLDAKYRVDSALDGAIASIHTYRDALVVAEDVDAGLVRRTVEAAFVVAPYIPDLPPEDWRRDRAPDVFFRDQYRSAFRFGAITMKPGLSASDVDSILDLLVGTAPGQDLDHDP